VDSQLPPVKNAYPSVACHERELEVALRQITRELIVQKDLVFSMSCNGMRNDMSWNRLQSLIRLGFTSFSKLVNSVLSDLGAMSVKVTFSFV
jgi:hypothetical protein